MTLPGEIREAFTAEVMSELYLKQRTWKAEELFLERE
jgi:hypothetical protein